MKSIKNAIIAFALIAMAVPAFAQQQQQQLINNLVGAAIGGGVARYATRGQDSRTQNIATAAGAIGGAWITSATADNSMGRQTRHMRDSSQYSQSQYQGSNNGQYNNSGSSYNNGQYNRPPMPTYQPASYQPPSNNGWNNQPPAPVVVVVEDSHQQDTYRQDPRQRQQSYNDGCDEYYYHNEYNPAAAQAYCKGHREAESKKREHAVKEAYAAGLSGR